MEIYTREYLCEQLGGLQWESMESSIGFIFILMQMASSFLGGNSVGGDLQRLNLFLPQRISLLPNRKLPQRKLYF
jgi:hypothetical protein